MNLVIFDVDGTLTATTGVDDECFVGAVREVMGFTIPDTDWSTYRHSTDQGLAVETGERWIGRAPTPDEVGAIKSRFIAALRERIGNEPGRCRGVEGVCAMMARVRTLEATGWRVGIASGAWAESAGLKLAAGGVDVSGVPATYSQAGADGQALLREEIIARTVEALSGDTAKAGPRRVVYVGDGVWDARAARALGIGFIGVRVDGREERLRAEGATRIVRGYGDVDGFVGLLEAAAG